LMLYFQ